MRILLLALVLMSTHLRAQDLPARLTTLFDTLAQSDQFSGAALVAEKGQIVWHKAYGKARENPERPLTENSVFELASVTKPFTALAIMQLKEKGLLAYNDQVTRFIPELPYQEITLLDLINHRSGLSDFTGWPSDIGQKSSPLTNADILNYLVRMSPNRPLSPQTVAPYSNTNYAILALVIERITGEPYPAYMQKHIFAPAGMNRTAFRTRDELKILPDGVQDFTWDGQANRLISSDSILPYTTHLSSVYGAYGMTSTTGDLFLAMKALMDGKFVAKATWDEAQKYKATSPFSATFGWVQIPDTTESPAYYTLGMFGGFSSVISHQTEDDRTIILLSNCADLTRIMDVMHPVTQVLDGEAPSLKPPTAQPKGIMLPNAGLQSFTGTYKQSTGTREQLLIYLQNGYLYGRTPGFPDRPLFPVSDNTLRSGNLNLTFEQPQNGKFQSLGYNTYQGETIMKRVE